MDPKDGFQHYHLGLGYEGTSRPQEAVSEYQKAAEVLGDSRSVVALAHAYSAAGKKAEAEKILCDVQRKLKPNSTWPCTMAAIYAGLGENEKAFDSLEKAYTQKSFDILSLKSDLLLDHLHPDPRCKGLLRRMGVPN